MNRSIALALLSLGTLGACQSSGELAQKPPTWTAAYQVDWRAMTNCLVARSQGPLVTVTPTFSSNRAHIAVKNPAGAILGTYDVRPISARGTEVAYRSIYGGPTTDAGGGAKDIADRCARP